MFADSRFGQDQYGGQLDELSLEAVATAGAFGSSAFGVSGLGAPAQLPVAPAAPVAAGIGSFAFGQSWFAQPDGTVELLPSASCSVNETLGDLLCNASASAPRETMGGGTGRRFINIELPPRQRSLPVSFALLECGLGELTLRSRVIAAETALGVLTLDARAVTGLTPEQEEEEEFFALLLLGIFDS